MDAKLGLTEAAVLDALTRALDVVPTDAKTAEEIAAATGVPIRRIREGLQRIQREGRLQRHSVPRTYIDGRIVPKPAYTILPKP